MSAIVIPFPAARRLHFVRRHARLMSTLSPDAAERHLRRQLRVQTEAMERKRIDRHLVERERALLEEAIRVELKRLVKQRGLMERQPAYYARTMALTLILLGLSLFLIGALDNLWLQLLNAVFLAFVFTQIGFIGHDIGHRQTMRESWHNVVAGLIFVLSSWSRPPRFGNDKHAHVLEYGALGALLARALAGGMAGVRGPAAPGAAVLGTIYGASDEWHQSFVPGREASLADLGADAFGSGVGSLAALAAGRWRRRAVQGGVA